LNLVLNYGGPVSVSQHIDGKLRTKHLAEGTANAAFRLSYLRREIALAVVPVRKLEHIPWAELDTELTALATFSDNVNQTVFY
jgi:hypothetical protein